MPHTTQLESANQPQVAASSSLLGDIVEYHLIPGDARSMTIKSCHGMELLPTNPRYVKRVVKLSRYRYKIVFTEAARQQRIEILFTPTKEE
jgi:hypothetical protein